MRGPSIKLAAAALASVLLLAGCQSNPQQATAGDGFTRPTLPDKSDLSSTGRNRYFILEPGHQLALESKGGDRLTITVLNDTKVVDGVETRVVEERETKNGQLAEVSRNFFAISKSTGDVFYFGEEVDDYKDGKITGHGGAWLAGKDRAKPGILIRGNPKVGQRYYQEVAPGVAMDRAQVVSTSETVTTPAGKFTSCLKTEETTPLEPADKEYKLYAPDVGLLTDGDFRLVRHGPAAAKPE